MLIKFDYRGYDLEYDEDTKQIKSPQLDLTKECYPFIIARLNKAFRDLIPGPKTKLNIGSGYRPFMDYINIDWDENVYPDFVRNVDEGLPFDSDKFEEVYTSHVIEHITDVFFFMSEIWRVLKNGGKATIIAPYCGFLDWAIQPDHKRFINWGFMDRWNPEHMSVQNELKQIRGAKFKLLHRELFNETKEIKFILEAIK